MASELLPPELNVPELPPEHEEEEADEDLHQGMPVLANPNPLPEDDPGQDIAEDDDIWEGMEVGQETTMTEVLGPDEDLMEDDDVGTDWDRPGQWLDPLNVESQQAAYGV